MLQKEERVSARSQFAPESIHRNIEDFEIFVTSVSYSPARDDMDYDIVVIVCDN